MSKGINGETIELLSFSHWKYKDVLIKEIALSFIQINYNNVTLYTEFIQCLDKDSSRNAMLLRDQM